MKLLEGKPIKEKIESEILKDVHSMRKDNIIAHLAVILVGHREDSELYVAIKKKRAQELGIDFSLYRFEEHDNQEKVIEVIKYLNKDPEIDGIIVQLPLPEDYDTNKVIDTIEDLKDVDDLKEKGSYEAPSSHAVWELMKEYDLANKDEKVVIVGRGRLIGRPLEKLLMKNGLNVTAIDMETKNLIGKIKEADLLIAATGSDNIITEELVKEGSKIISVGNEVNFEDVKDHVEAITPKIGGVGPITVSLLLKNTVLAAKKRIKKHS